MEKETVLNNLIERFNLKESSILFEKERYIITSNGVVALEGMHYDFEDKDVYVDCVNETTGEAIEPINVRELDLLQIMNLLVCKYIKN